jgi:hypothetical protein
MRSEELEYRCAELKSRMLAGSPSAEARSSHPLRPKVKLPPVVPQPSPLPHGDIVDPHPLIAGTRKHIRREPIGFAGLMYLSDAQRLDMSVSRPALKRALWIMDAILKRLHEERMPVRIEKVKDGQGWGTFVQVEDEPIRIRLREATIRVEQEPSPSEQRRRRQDPSAYWFREYESKPTRCTPLCPSRGQPGRQEAVRRNREAT